MNVMFTMINIVIKKPCEMSMFGYDL